MTDTQKLKIKLAMQRHRVIDLKARMSASDGCVVELTAALGALLTQVYQMQGMFDDSDGAISRAVEYAEEAEAHGLAHLSAVKERRDDQG